MTRRPVGSGTLRERKPGTWELRVFVGRDPVTGRPRQASRTVRATSKTVNRELAKFIVDLGDRAHPATNATVAQVLEEWLRHAAARGRAPRTIHEARRSIDTVFVPAIGDVRARELTNRHLDELYRQLLTGEGRDRPLKPSSVRRHHAVLSAALAMAEKWGWIDKSPAPQAELAPLGRPVLTIPSFSEVTLLLQAAKKRNERWGILLALAVGTGARRGELCALRWPDVGDGMLRIRRSLYRAGADRGEKTTKGGAERWVAMSPPVADLLADWRLRCEEIAAAAVVELVPDAFVVSPLPDGSRPVNPDTLSSVVHQLCAPASKDNPHGLGIPHVHLHSLRHFAATELLGSDGADVRNVAEILGHVDPALTLRLYVHATAARQRKAIDALGRTLMPAESTPDAKKPPAC